LLEKEILKNQRSITDLLSSPLAASRLNKARLAFSRKRKRAQRCHLMNYPMSIEKWGRYWAVFWEDELVCVCVYKRGAKEVCSRLSFQGKNQDSSLHVIEMPAKVYQEQIFQPCSPGQKAPFSP
jgi:hypothetical protein